MNKALVCAAAMMAIAVPAYFLAMAQPGAERSPVEQELWRHRNLGKALFENPAAVAQAPVELKKALDLAPESFRDELNYGLALLRAGELDDAIAHLEKAQARNPKLPHTWFNLGIAYKRKARYEDAIRQFQRMTELVPEEAVAHYNLGLLYTLTGRTEDGLTQFQTAVASDARMVAPRFQIYNYYRLSGNEAEARRALAGFKQVKGDQQAADDSEDVEWCFYAELYDPATAPAGVREPAPPAPLQFEPRTLTGRVDPKSAGMGVMDVDGAGSAGLSVWSKNGLLLFDGGGKPVAAPLLRDVVSAAPGDFDNDGLTDLCVLTGTGARLYRNVKGRFQEVAAALPSGHFDAAIWLDFDHDYDLDLLLLGAKSVLLRNEGASGFHDYTSHFPFAAGRAIAAVVLRVTPDTKAADLAVAYAEHAGVLYRDRLRGVYEATPLDAVPPGATGLRAADPDNDSWMDLAFSAAGETLLAVNHHGKFERQPALGTGPFALADFENRGFADALVGRTVRRNQGRLQFASAQVVASLPQTVMWAAADFNGDGRVDLAAISADGTLSQMMNRTDSGNGWLGVKLEGVKNVKAAPGTEVEIKGGDFYQKQVYAGVPLVFGLGGRKLVDTVRLTWPNGMIQNEINQRVNRLVKVKEAPRLSGSCPMVFAWNGRTFQFITDVLGVAPLGASSGDGENFPVDHKEYVRIPEDTLVPKDGRYEIRITEELNEVTYLDQVRLAAVDHPAEVRVFTNDKFKPPPFPEFRLFGVRKRVAPVWARADGARDVRERVLRPDGMYAGPLRHDYSGVAERHTLELDFGAAATAVEQPVLFLNGWVDWADGSTFLGASQGSRDGLVFPYLQVKDAAGMWRTVVADMGIPAGKPKTIAVDLTGRFLSRSRQVRIVTNLCVYWDEIFLADGAAPEVRLTHMDADTAELRLRGFSAPVIDPKRERPETFDYARWTPAASWNQIPGMYTRYGEVGELVRGLDDRLAIMGPGDELTLRFDGGPLPALPRGWRRDFLLFVDGWAKDADANTAFSETVEPLPFHGMSGYPYRAAERFPDDAAHRAYRERYNTRRAARFLPPLVAAGRPVGAVR